VPYTLKFVERPATVTEPGRTEQPARVAPGGGEAVAVAPREGPGRGIVVTPSPVEQPPERFVPDPTRFRLVGDSDVSAAEQAVIANDAVAMEELNKAAPLTATVTQDAVTGNITITWWAAFMPATGEGGAP
jgi:hypothetical protein